MVTCPMWTMTARAEAAIIRSVLRLLPGLKVAPITHTVKIPTHIYCPTMDDLTGAGSFTIRFVVLLAAPMPRDVARRTRVQRLSCTWDPAYTASIIFWKNMPVGITCFGSIKTGWSAPRGINRPPRGKRREVPLSPA
jgi:hypothetical protein